MATTYRTLANRGFNRVAVRESGPVPRRLKPAHNAANKESWRETAIHHHRTNRAKRFTKAGARELDFRARSSEYERRKRRVKGHNRPNVWSGESERRSRQVRVTSTSKSARMRYSIPALNFHSGAKEFRRISKSEAGELAKFHGRRYERHLERE